MDGNDHGFSEAPPSATRARGVTETPERYADVAGAERARVERRRGEQMPREQEWGRADTARQRLGSEWYSFYKGSSLGSWIFGSHDSAR